MFQCSYCNYESIYKFNVQRHEHVHNKNSTQNNIAPTRISVDSNVNNLLNQTKSGFGSVVTSPTTMYVGDSDPPTTINANSNTVPLEDYNNVVGIAHGWKKECEKMQEAYRLLQENFREAGENSHAIISYLQNVLNANNIRYNLDLA